MLSVPSFFARPYIYKIHVITGQDYLPCLLRQDRRVFRSVGPAL
jgi:hypothetical protein